MHSPDIFKSFGSNEAEEHCILTDSPCLRQTVMFVEQWMQLKSEKLVT